MDMRVPISCSGTKSFLYMQWRVCTRAETPLERRKNINKRDLGSTFHLWYCWVTIAYQKKWLDKSSKGPPGLCDWGPRSTGIDHWCCLCWENRPWITLAIELVVGATGSLVVWPGKEHQGRKLSGSEGIQS